MSEYSKYFSEPSHIKLSHTVDEANAMTDEDFKKVRAEFDALCMTREDELRSIEDMGRNNGGCVSWDASCSFEEYARRVRAGEDIDDE